MLPSQEVDAIISDVVNPSTRNGKAIERMLQEVGKLLDTTRDSMPKIYADVEAASSLDSLKQAVVRFKGLCGIFLGLQLSPECSALLSEAIVSLGVSGLMASFLETAASAQDALSGYKSAIVEQLAASLRRGSAAHCRLDG